MPRALKVIGYRERADCFLPRDVLTAIGAPRHVQQGQILIWATTIQAAYDRANELGLRVRSPRDLGIQGGRPVELIQSARTWPEGTVLAWQGYHGAVVEISPNPDAGIVFGDRSYAEPSYRVTPVGSMEFSQSLFIPAPDFEPEVTDAMMAAAVAATADKGRYTYVHDESIRAIIAAALKAQRSVT